MKNWKSTWVWAILAVFTSFDAKSQALQIMTYNIRLDVASDGENAWEHRRDFLVAQIKFYEPDIFGTQEGLPHQIEYLKEQFPNFQSEGIGREGGGKGESTHIFFEKSKFLLRKSHTFWLSPTPDTVSMGWDAACLRVCTAVLLKNKRTKQQFWVFNTHLDHVGEIARARGIELILTKIKALNRGNLPLILMGDLNARPDSPVIVRLNKELDNTRNLSRLSPLGPEGTFNGFKFGESNLKLIDYIFVARNAGIRVLKYAVLVHSRNERYPSDHFPVYVELEFGK